VEELIQDSAELLDAHVMEMAEVENGVQFEFERETPAKKKEGE
jgi:hypothetical protein